MRNLLFLLPLSIALQSVGQVRSDGAVVLTGPDPSDRQVTGLAPTLDPGSALSAGEEQAGTLRYVPNVQGSDWQIDPMTLDVPLQPGTQLMIVAPTAVTGPITVRVGTEGPFALEWRQGVGVNGEDIPQGMVVSAVFDGNAFQVLNGRADQLRACPSGMAAVGTQFCIERQQRAALEFFPAALNCGSVDRRLCTWAEFIAACTQAATLGMTAGSVDWEWSNDSANEQYNVRIMRLATCASPSTRSAVGGAGAPYRCCSTR